VQPAHALACAGEPAAAVHLLVMGRGLAKHVKPFRFILKFGRWLEIGVARAEDDGTIRLFLDRLPLGGFTGGVLLSPRGTTPALPEPPPRRPGDVEDDDPLDS
jgi:hypothetical protein